MVKAEALAIRLDLKGFKAALFKVRYKPDCEDESIFRPFAVNTTKCRKKYRRISEVEDDLWTAWRDDDGEEIGRLLSDGLIYRAPQGTVLFTQFVIISQVTNP